MKVKVFINNKGRVWKQSNKLFSVLCEFVRKKLNDSNQFVLEYNDQHNLRSLISNQDTLNEALQIAEEQSRPCLKIYVIIDTTNNEETIKSATIDFAVFNSKSTDCKKDFICRCTNRLVIAMKYYQTLDIANSENDKQKLIDFCDNAYPHMLDDFTHLLTAHPGKLDDMYDFATKNMGMKPCSMETCFKQKRHNRDRHNDIDLQHENIVFVFKRDMMDGVHCYLLHQYDFGFAIHRSQKDEIIQECKTDDLYVDNAFKHVSKIISEAKNKVQIVRLEKQNKYNLTKQLAKEQMQSAKRVTFMDGIYECLEIKQRELLFDQEYDTDSIRQPVSVSFDNEECNLRCILNKHSFQNVCDTIRSWKIHGRSFSIGFIFYYWDYYKNKIDEEADFRNINHHSGHQKHELFVKHKYKTCKSEILNNNLHSLTKSQFNICMCKAEKYFETKKVRGLKAANRENELHYAINEGTPITMQHMLVLILYCDWTDLSTMFSTTFRKYMPNESLLQLKKRNSEYWNFSKLLREAVEYYGCCGEGDFDEEQDKYINKLAGPFFSGLSFEMVFPHVNIRLCGPTSTSKQIEVATRFAHDEGVVMALNNNGDHTSSILRAFPCTWFSNYNGEDEYLFMGGHTRIRLANVHLKNGWKSFPDILEVLFYFECMINGTWMNSEFESSAVNEAKYQILLLILRHRVGLATNSYPKYINSMFESMCWRKFHVVINLDEINRNFSYLKKLVINPETNLFQPILYDLFNRCEQYIFYTTTPDGETEYELKIESLLQLMTSTNAPKTFQVMINARSKKDRYSKEKTWIANQIPHIRKLVSTSPNFECDFKSKLVEQQQRDKLTIIKKVKY